MNSNTILRLIAVCGLLLISAGLAAFYFLYFRVATKRHEISDAWMFDTPLDLMNSSAAGYQIFVFPLNDKQLKIIRESQISYEEACWQLCGHLQMKYYGWFHAMEKNATRHIFKNPYSHLERWQGQNILCQCENVNDLYIVDYFTSTFHDSAKLCESVGLQLIDELDFAKFPDYFIEARNLSKQNAPVGCYDPFASLTFWVDKTLSELSLEENKTLKIDEQFKSTKVFTTYHTSLNCYSQNIARNSPDYSILKTFICEDDYLTADRRLKIHQWVSYSFEDECSYLNVNATFLESFKVSNDISRLEAMIDVQATDEWTPDLSLWGIRVPNPDENENLTWCKESPKPLDVLVASLDDDNNIEYKIAAKFEEAAFMFCKKRDP